MNQTTAGGIVTLLALASLANASSILDYEGDTLPELDGWTPVGETQTPDRYVTDGILTLYSPPNTEGADYRKSAKLQGGSTLYEWSSRCLDTAGGSGIQFVVQGPAVWSIVLVSWNADHASFYLYPDSLSTQHQYKELPIEPSIFHNYRLEAAGSTYTVFLDGTPLLSKELQDGSGLTVQTQFGSTHSFFDQPTQSEWDYVRITPTPEPTTIVLLPTLIALFSGRARRASRVPNGSERPA